MSGPQVVPPVSLVAPPVRAFFAPVDRSDAAWAAFDPAVSGRFPLSSPPAGWMDAGPIAGFERASGTVLTAVRSGAPAVVKAQVRSATGAEVQCTFPCWSKLAMALSCGSEQMNLLAVAPGANAAASGGAATGAEALGAGSTATALVLQAGSQIAAGDVVVVDHDYAGETGYVGAGAPGTYVASAASVNNDAQYIRRVSLNVARVLSVSNGVATLATPLLAGAPDAQMKIAVVQGFVDREGGSVAPEWSGLFVAEGVQGDRMIFHYPRLQPCTGAVESRSMLAAGLERWRPVARFQALPVTDPNDGSTAVCFRSYLPAPGRKV